ncbi:MAG: diaminopimelate epimerase, partial [Candidatus Margulisiibacteriota bacterium]
IMIPAIIEENGKFIGVEVDMGIPRIEALNEELIVGATIESGPVPDHSNIQNFKINKISMGNPHCVIFVDDLEGINLSEIGPVIENLPQFQDRTNVEFAKVLNKGEIALKVWERGAGATLACGTGACATVAAAILNDLTDRKVVVHLPGGDLEIEWARDKHLLMRGPAEKVFEGKLRYNSI